MRSVLADVAELVDVLDLGSSAARRGGSTPFTRTKSSSGTEGLFLFITFIGPGINILGIPNQGRSSQPNKNKPLGEGHCFG